MSKNRKGKPGKIGEMLNKSPINYFSDLFIVAMVLAIPYGTEVKNYGYYTKDSSGVK